jgi:hypothetical protein
VPDVLDWLLATMGGPAQEQWTTRDPVVPGWGLGPNAAGIYGRAPAAAPMDNRDVVLPPEGYTRPALPNVQAGNPDFPQAGMPQADPMWQKRSLYDIIRRFHEGNLPVPLSEAIQGRTYDQGRSSAVRASSPLDQMLPRGGWM